MQGRSNPSCRPAPGWDIFFSLLNYRNMLRPNNIYFDVDLYASYLLKVRNYEFFVFYESTIDRMKRVLITDEYIALCLQNLMRHQESVTQLGAKALSHEATEEIRELLVRSHDLLMGMKRSVDALVRMPDEEVRGQARVLDNWLRAVRRNMVSRVQVRQIEAVKVLERTADENEAVQAALEGLGLDKIFGRVRDLHRDMVGLRYGRNDDKGLYKEMRDGFRAEVVFDLQILLEGLRGAASMEGEEQAMYRRMCVDINELLVSTKAIYKARLTRIENEKLLEDQDSDDQDEPSDDDASILPEGEGDAPSDADDDSDSDFDDDDEFDDDEFDDESGAEDDPY